MGVMWERYCECAAQAQGPWSRKCELMPCWVTRPAQTYSEMAGDLTHGSRAARMSLISIVSNDPIAGVAGQHAAANQPHLLSALTSQACLAPGESL